jgi:PAS domain S-box-containing protein
MEVLGIIDKNKEAMIIPDGISVIGRDEKIIVFNEAASRITEFEEDDIVGESCRILFTEEEFHFVADSLTENRAFTNLALNIIDKRGNNKSVLASITPIVKDNSVLSVVLVFRDTNEMLKMAEDVEAKTQELIDQKNKLDAIFNSNIEGTFTIDYDWNITSFNLSAEKITGYKKNEAVGMKCWDVFKSSICRNGCHMEQTIHKGKSTIGNELEIQNKSGMKVPIKVNSGILLNNKNEKIGAVETFIDISEIKNLSAHLKKEFGYANIIGKNKELDKIYRILESVSGTDSSVLITGESGTGKELAARAIHIYSERKSGPFIAVNCSAFVENLIESELFGHEKGAFTGAIQSRPGRFELAQGGTLFLDEIGDLSLTIQTKLLRVLETRTFERVGGNKNIKMNSRIIAATNKDLLIEIKEGRFREDLFYRINVINIHLPPLRERMDDFPLLVNHFIKQFNERFSKSITHFSPAAYDCLERYSWKGNIRELENVIEHCFVLCRSEVIMPEHLPDRIRCLTTPLINKIDLGIEETEKRMILNTLNANEGNRLKTAEALRINPSTLWRKMKKYKIEFKTH